MEIPNGITGFYMAGEVQPPQVDEKQFKRVYFELAVSNNGKVIQFNTPEYPMNFYSVRVGIFEKQFYILLNEHYPYLAFTSDVSYGNITFIDMPVLYEHLIPQYTVLKTNQLNLPMNEFKENNSLNSAEISQIDWVHD